MEPPPAFLSGTLAAMSLRRRAGEWDLAVTPTRPRAALDAFLTAFDWADVSALDIMGRRWTGRDGHAFASWVMDSADTWEDATGFEAVLDLTLAWQAPDGRVGSSWLPEAGRLTVDAGDDMSAFTVWPNLFTDRVRLYEPVGTRFDPTSVPFPRAARENRRRLRASLQAWEAATGGTIDGWDSELVVGVERYGFREDARPR